MALSAVRTLLAELAPARLAAPQPRLTECRRRPLQSVHSSRRQCAFRNRSAVARQTPDACGNRSSPGITTSRLQSNSCTLRRFVFSHGSCCNIALRTQGDDLAATTKNRRILNYADVGKRMPSPRRRCAAHGYQLADVGQKQVGGCFNVCSMENLAALICIYTREFFWHSHNCTVQYKSLKKRQSLSPLYSEKRNDE